MANASTRAWIRWPPEDPYESTSTLVLSCGSPENYFVDIRVKTQETRGPLEKPALSVVKVEAVSLDHLDWAFAGVSERIEQSTAQELENQNGKAAQLVTKGKWYHQIDSKTRIGEKPVDDEGDLYSYNIGDKENVFSGAIQTCELEKGRMLNPATGNIQEYEELWVDVDINEHAGVPLELMDDVQAPRCVVAKACHKDDTVVRGMIILAGEWCQGVMRTGEDFVAQRWRRGASNGWECLVKIGKGQLPEPTALKKLCTNSKGSDIVEEGVTWVVEVSR